MYEGLDIYIDSLFMIFFGGATAAAILACVYLLFRRGNAFAPDVTPPLHLRRWTAAFFAVIALSHVWWYFLIKYNPFTDSWMSIIVASGLDTFTVWPILMIMLLMMLQDRRRPLWPVAVAMAPIAIVLIASIVLHSDAFLSPLVIYFLLMFAAFIIYDIRSQAVWSLAARQLCRSGAQGGEAQPHSDYLQYGDSWSLHDLQQRRDF